MKSKAGLSFVFAGLLAAAAGCTPEFAGVPAGAFVMGSPAGELGRDADEAQHGVTISRNLEFGATEVTQKQFQDRLGYNPSHDFSPYGRGGDVPANNVSWYDALAYANARSAQAGLAPCFTLTEVLCADETIAAPGDVCAANGGIASASVAVNAAGVSACEGYRLPTEAEWEYAARAGTTTALPSGDIARVGCSPRDPAAHAVAQFCGNVSLPFALPVARKNANAWDLYDAAGNVAEWTWDWYAKDYGGAATDPEGPATGRFKSVRGGAVAYHGAAKLRSAARAGHTPGFRDRHLGFRIARSLGAPAAVPPPPVVAASAAPAPKALPDALPFEFTRPDVGEPLTPAEISAFTAKITGFWRDAGFFGWLARVGHGMGPNAEGWPEFKLYWQDTRAIKSGGVVEFEHYGGADNLNIPTPKFLSAAAAGYLAGGDEAMRRVAEGYARGMAAVVLGLVAAEEDPEPMLMTRSFFPHNHAYVEDGRAYFIDYDPAKSLRFDWNAHTIPNATNPYYGVSTWVRNMRSKDDVPHIFRAVPTLLRLAQDAPDAAVREAAADAAAKVAAFARDIADTGWYIRTKDMHGDAFVPLNDAGTVNDLASFTEYNFLVPDAECAPKLTAALLSYGEPLGVDCGESFGSLYELVASIGHYYNVAIIRYFHAAALGAALIAGEDAVALELLAGMADRADEIMAAQGPNVAEPGYWPDGAGFLVAAGTVGLPLTSREARLVVEQYDKAVDHYATWPNWDLWSPSVPDGEQPWKPGDTGALGKVVDIDEMAYLLEYCGAPFRNEASAPVVDCEIVLDPARWGEGA